jgi:fructose-1,6-bisphosphatase/sedoheptulose 1,7-bisphosphatase-like protein
MLGRQISEFQDAMQNFVAAFQNIGVRVVFFFDGDLALDLDVARKKRNLEVL